MHSEKVGSGSGFVSTSASILFVNIYATLILLKAIPLGVLVDVQGVGG